MKEQATDDLFDFDFTDRIRGCTVLVAGATGGLGSAASVLLAQDGATVVAGYKSNVRRAEALQQHVRTLGADLHLVEGDVADPEVRKRYVESADAIGEGIYGLICFTGDPARVKFAEAEDSDLQDSMEANYVAPLLLAREAAAAMKRRQISGSIVLISSMQAVGVFESSVNYAGPKVALIHAARIIARELGGPEGIRVNVVAPGVNQAGMALASIESGKYDFYLEEGIVPRFGRPEDVARVVRLLMEPDNYITGELITVDGGLTLRR